MFGTFGLQLIYSFNFPLTLKTSRPFLSFGAKNVFDSSKMDNFVRKGNNAIEPHAYVILNRHFCFGRKKSMHLQCTYWVLLRTKKKKTQSKLFVVNGCLLQPKSLPSVVSPILKRNVSAK